ncbi:MAG: galactokinase family protein, partial [Bacteroidota bacterium]
MPALRTPASPIEYSRKRLVERAADLFKTTFGTEPACIATAPGRVNLIGEHTDYNNGFVLPAAINRSIAVAAAPRSDRMLCVHSHNLHSLVQLSVDALHPLKYDTWANYIAGVAYFLKRNGVPLGGANLCIMGNIPQAAGLSSSAALELASANVLSALYNGRFT